MKYLRPALILFVVALLAYGLLILRLGFYWDDLPILWIRYQLGAKALVQYFSTNRPVWGLLYQITTRILPPVPIYWQIFALIWRWLGAVVVFALLQKVWRDDERVNLGAALLFLVYPGFNQHSTAFLFSHFFIVFFFLLFSFYCMVQANETSQRYWVWTITGMIFAALNLWMMEYYYALELARVGIILAMLRSEPFNLRDRFTRALKLWLPYLIVFALAVLSRLFIFNNQIYGMGLTGQLKSAPMETIVALLGTVRLTLRLVFKNAWFNTVDFSEVTFFDSISASYYFVFAIAILIMLAGILLVTRESKQEFRICIKDKAWMLFAGAIATLLAGAPFWLINFTPSLNWPASRFALPFALGVSMVIASLIGSIPWEKFKIALFVALIGLAVGKQYLNAQLYARDWSVQKDLFWQLMWRAPGIKPDTLVLLNEGPLNFYADNSLAAALNWIYAPDNHSDKFDYALFFPKTRLHGELPQLEPNIPIHYDFLAAQFDGNTSQTLVMYYDPPKCLRVFDPEIERLNRSIPETSLMRYAARLSVPDQIVNDPTAKMLPFYGAEPAHDFCYYFERAELARQNKDWKTVAEMGDKALSLDNHPYEPAEQFVFIEGYANMGEWDRAIKLSEKAYEFSPDPVGAMLCQLWEKIGAETSASSAGRSVTLSKVSEKFGCNP